ncbi:lithostathine-1-like [Asterias rubens]|uniref:lithostathine-1-like n=1 Tax=Asterias rubens TaxID=7604 RepID=UPI0014555984|nr:lithostathine-1-like [Asterias rubens]
MNIFKVSSLLLGLGCGSILADICQQKNCQRGNCPPNWRKDGASCYFITEKMTWNNATSFCPKYGATLGIPNSQSEHEFIWEFFLQKIQDTTTGPDLWIGVINPKGNLYDARRSDASGSYENWAANQPDASSDSHCVSMWGDRGGKWDDKPCNRENYAVCKLPVPVTTNTPLFCLYTGDDGRLGSQ